MVVKKKTDEQVEFELIKEGKIKKSNNSGHYVSNKELYEECCKYYEMYKKAMDEGKPRPKLTEKQGAAIIQIATRRCSSRSYARYTNNWKEEMIADAIATITHRCVGFKPDKSTNPFSYYTAICNHAINKRIFLEKKQAYIRCKMIENNGGFYGLNDDNIHDEDIQSFDEGVMDKEQILKTINDFEEKHIIKKKKEKEIVDEESVLLDKFISDTFE